MARLNVGDRVRVRETGELGTVTCETVPYMRLVQVDGDSFETHIPITDLERVA